MTLPMRVSATTLESFRLWLQPDQEWMTEDDLLATIRGQFVPTPEILVGSAFGKVLEKPEKYRIRGGYAYADRRFAGPITFSDDTMAPALALMNHKDGVFEAKAAKDYPGGVTVISVADQLVGARLYEHKTTTSTFSAEKYLDSFQWRLMVDAFEPVSVTYHVFMLDDHGNSVVEVKAIESLTVYPYPDCHRDCADLVRQFVEYCELRGLVDLLRKRSRYAGIEAA